MVSMDVTLLLGPSARSTPDGSGHMLFSKWSIHIWRQFAASQYVSYRCTKLWTLETFAEKDSDMISHEQQSKSAWISPDIPITDSRTREDMWWTERWPETGAKRTSHHEMSYSRSTTISLPTQYRDVVNHSRLHTRNKAITFVIKKTFGIEVRLQISIAARYKLPSISHFWVDNCFWYSNFS